MRAALYRASDWIYILLADSQRSPVCVMFEKRFGSPVRMRTCNPVVNSLGLKGFVFSSGISSQTALGDARSLLWSAKLIPVRSESAVCSFAYFCCCNGKCVLFFAAVVTAALGHVKDSRSRSCAPFGRSRPLLQCLRLVTAGSCEHLANCHAGDYCSWDRRNRFCSRRLFGLALCGSDRNDFGVFEHARS